MQPQNESADNEETEDEDNLESWRVKVTVQVNDYALNNFTKVREEMRDDDGDPVQALAMVCVAALRRVSAGIDEFKHLAKMVQEEIAETLAAN
jgi:hypothetical protein